MLRQTEVVSTKPERWAADLAGAFTARVISEAQRLGKVEELGKGQKVTKRKDS